VTGLIAATQLAAASISSSLNPFSPEDAQLLEAVNDAKFTVADFCNADLRQALYGNLRDVALEKKRANKVTRLIRLLRAHGLLIKISKANRYDVRKKGSSGFIMGKG